MKMKHALVRFAWMMVALVAVGLFCTAWGQTTNGTLTNLPPIAPTNPFPAGTDAIWFAVIPLVTFGITWLVGKIRSLPTQVIPLLTPIIGVAVGSLIEWATNAHFPWWSQAGAGAVSVAIYEALKGLTNAGPESALTPNARQKSATS
jgi:hypothetical protein